MSRRLFGKHVRRCPDCKVAYVCDCVSHEGPDEHELSCSEWADVGTLCEKYAREEELGT